LGALATLFSKAKRMSPTKADSPPKARLYPTTAQTTAIRMKLCIIVPSTFFRRTSPP
jgi:hypothetical protein